MIPKQEKGEKQKRPQNNEKTGALVALLAVGVIAGMFSCTSCDKNNIDPNGLKPGDSVTVEDGGITNVDNNGNTDYSESDEEALICLIASEATYATSEEMAAIASVVLNRAKHNGCYEFPNSVKEVIYQQGQFESVYLGTIMPIDLVMEDKELYNKVLAGVKEAKNNDTTNGALFFMKVEEGVIPFPNGHMIGEYSFTSEWPPEW